MEYFYQFDIAAFLMTPVLAAPYFLRRQYPTRVNRLYITMVALLCISSAADVLNMLPATSGLNVPMWFNYVMSIIYLLSYNMLPPVFYYYVLHITKAGSITRFDAACANIVVAVEAILLALTPSFKLVFYYDAEGVYHRAPAGAAMYMLGIFLLIRMVVLIMRYRKRINLLQTVTICCFIVLVMVSVVVQMLYPAMMISNLVCGLCLILFNLSMQNPGDYFDKTSGCYNLDAFTETIGNYMGSSTPFTVVAFVADDYAYLSRSLGEEAGNAILFSTGEALRGMYKDRLVYYLSNGCFALVLTKRDCAPLDAAAAIEAHFKKPITVGSMEILLTPWLTIVEYPDFVQTPRDVLDTLNYAMHEQVAGHRQRVAVASEASLAKRRRINRITHIMRQALDNGGFEVYYQPILRTGDSAFATAEALVRLHDEELGFISPEEFIPIAEQNGMIVPIGEQVFRSVCTFIQQCRPQALGVEFIEVNLSTAQLLQSNFADRFKQIMAEYGIPGELLDFEITETAGAKNTDILRKNIDAIIDNGSSFSMDDYGTGFSTANYLISLPVQIVKIDKSLLWPAMESKDALIILQHTVKMLQTLNKKIVVEGVETEEMRNLLLSMNCDYLQGYLYSKPIPADKYVAFLERARERQVAKKPTI